MQAKVKVWVVFGDRVKLGDGRAHLLKLIDELGSLRKAAAHLEMSYRYAWAYLCDRWNKKAGLCENCAPDLDEEIAAAQAAAAKEQVNEKVRQVDYLGQRDLAQVAPALCPKCGAKTQGGKFCPECGTSISAKKKCVNCGAGADGSPKFCPECGKAFGS